MRKSISRLAASIGLGASLDYLASLDAHAVERHESSLHQHLLRGLADRDGIRVLGAPQAALASFVIEGVHNADIAHLLTEQGIAVRAGHHCAKPLMRLLGANATVRASFYLYNTPSEVDALGDALAEAGDFFTL